MFLYIHQITEAHTQKQETKSSSTRVIRIQKKTQHTKQTNLSKSKYLYSTSKLQEYTEENKRI